MIVLSIPFHSFIDVITNSSTEIFVGCHSNTIAFAKDFINELLKVSKSDKTADDLFEFEIVGENDNEYNFDERRLVIKAKEDSDIVINLSKKMKDIFCIDGVYNG